MLIDPIIDFQLARLLSNPHEDGSARVGVSTPRDGDAPGLLLASETWGWTPVDAESGTGWGAEHKYAIGPGTDRRTTGEDGLRSRACPYGVGYTLPPAECFSDGRFLRLS